jgi:hypothetical protein
MTTTESGAKTADRNKATAVAEHPDETVAPSEPSAGAPQAPSAHHVSAGVPPAGLGAVGVLTLLVGAWGGIVPFVGPTFGFSADGSVSWYWSLAHALLWLAPGAVAVACGLMMLGLVPRAVAGVGRVGSWTTGFVAAVCGAWFVVGPVAWPVLKHSAGVFVPASPIRELAYQVGYSLGPGVLLGMLGAFVMGWAVRSRHVVTRGRVLAEVPAA